ncbi:MAG: glucokinase [Rhodospirillaceae bacterium]
MTTPYLLAADVGGTKTEIAWGQMLSGRITVIDRRVYLSGDYETIDALIDDFAARLKGSGYAVAGSSACLAVAGPVDADDASLTNLPWRINAPSLASRYGLHAVRIINDFEGVGHGLIHLAPDEMLSLQAGGRHPRGTRVAVGAGTGLGVALLTYGGGHYHVHPTEAGHADFAPNDETQDELLAWLRRQLGHVSYERILSGSGLTRVFQFLMECGYGMPTTALQQALQGDDAASVVSALGLQGRDPLAARALDIFVQVYGAFAGNMALTTLARGGVYIAGGIAPKIAAKITDGRFMQAFLDKGRFRDLLMGVPVDVVMNPAVGLYGAFEVASRLADTAPRT